MHLHMHTLYLTHTPLYISLTFLLFFGMVRRTLVFTS